MYTAKELVDVLEFHASIERARGTDLDYRHPEPLPGEKVVVFEPFEDPRTGETRYRLKK